MAPLSTAAAAQALVHAPCLPRPPPPPLGARMVAALGRPSRGEAAPALATAPPGTGGIRCQNGLSILASPARGWADVIELLPLGEAGELPARAPAC